jgi:hypothetical protein
VVPDKEYFDMANASVETIIRYNAKDWLKLNPGQAVQITVTQRNIDEATPGDNRNCAFVRAIHGACSEVYRAEVEGNHVYIWIDISGEKWKLMFYMTQEVWKLATQFDKDRTDVEPVTLPICFHEGEQVNRVSKNTRKVHQFEPDVGPGPKAKLESQVLSAMPEPVIKPISVPGERAARAAAKAAAKKTQSRWAREGYIKSKKSDESTIN